MSTDEIKALSILTPTALAPVIIPLSVAFRRSHGATAFLSLTAFGVGIFLLTKAWGWQPLWVAQLLVMDKYSLFFIGLIYSAGIITALLSHGYLNRRAGNREEFYILVLLASIGSSVLASSAHMASFFLGVELLGVSLYGLVAYNRVSGWGMEAGIKYLVLAAVASGFLLFGMALVYAGAGSLSFSGISRTLYSSGSGSALLAIGSAMILIGVGFKLGLAPFHLWTPDVYEGAPAPVSAFIASVSKAGVFAVLLRYFTIYDMRMSGRVLLAVSVIAVASMLIGNILALLQNNVKRMLAYSSISHMGYVLAAFPASRDAALVSSLVYLFVYVVTTLAAFGVVSALSGAGGERDSLEDYRGLARERPWLAAVFTVALFSLAGIPLTAGFIGKFYVAAVGVGAGLWTIVSVLVLGSVISIYYYLKVVVIMFQDGTGRAFSGHSLAWTEGIALAAVSLAILFIGMYPAPLILLLEMPLQIAA